MREILFRGKRLDNGEWIEGIPINTHIGTFIVFEENPHFCDQYGYMEIDELAKVDPATVGQYTGLRDRNGKRIFEGDVLVSFFCDDVPNYGERSVVLWHKHAWCSQYRDYKPETLEEYEMSNYVDVIGNIYDNPELLEQEAGK